MDSSDEHVQVEGLDDQDIDDIMGDEYADGDEFESRRTLVERQNDLLVAGKIKEFVKSLMVPDAKADSNLSQNFFLKRDKAAAKSAAVGIDQTTLKQELPDLQELVSNLKNNAIGMRLKLAEVQDELAASGTDQTKSLSIVNLRTEVLLEYWSYLSLFSIMKLNGDQIAGHPIIDRLLYLKQVLSKLKPVYKKMDFQISRLVGMAGKKADEINLNNQEDLMMMRPNLAFEDFEGGDGAMDQEFEDEDDDDRTKISKKVRDRIEKKVDRAMDSGYGEMDKSQKKDFIRAIQEKRERISKEDRKKEQFSDFKRKRLLGSKFVQDMDNELAQRPHETEKRANINGVYDPMQDKRDKYDESNFSHTVLTKEQKKTINKRVNRIKQQSRVDDLTELDDIGELMGSGKRIFGTKKDKHGGKDGLKSKPGESKKRSAWQKNTDEEQYDSKRQSRLKGASKIKGKKKGRK